MVKPFNQGAFTLWSGNNYNNKLQYPIVISQSGNSYSSNTSFSKIKEMITNDIGVYFVIKYTSNGTRVVMDYQLAGNGNSIFVYTFDYDSSNAVATRFTINSTGVTKAVNKNLTWDA